MWSSLHSSCFKLSESWTCVSSFFNKLGEFLVIISSYRFLIPWSLSSPSATPTMLMLCFTLSQRSHQLSSFFLIVFAALFGCFLLLCHPNCWFNPLLYSTYFFIPFDIFFISNIEFFILDCFFMVSISFSCCYISKYLVVLSKFFEHPYNYFSELYIWWVACLYFI